MMLTLNNAGSQDARPKANERNNKESPKKIALRVNAPVAMISLHSFLHFLQQFNFAAIQLKRGRIRGKKNLCSILVAMRICTCLYVSHPLLISQW